MVMVRIIIPRNSPALDHEIQGYIILIEGVIMGIRRDLARNLAVVALGLLISSGSVTATANTKNVNNVKQADSLIKEWLSLEQQRNAMLNDWHQQQPLLEQRLSLLKQEQSQLEKDLSTANINDSDVNKKRSELLQSQSEMEAQQGLLETSLVNYYQLVAQLQPQLPPPLRKAWHNKLSEAEFSNADTTARLNTLLELLEKLHDFEQRISHVQSALILPSNDGDKEGMVHQLYLGLSQAWYVSLDGRLVGRGQPTAAGWQWLSDDAVDGDTLFNAIAMIERKTEAKFLKLPISLSGGK